MKPAWFVLIATSLFAQESAPPQATMKQLMLELIHPASNDIQLFVNRGGPQSKGTGASEWATIRRSALTLAEAGNLLTMRGRARDQGDWMKDAKMLVDVGTAAYRAAQAQDLSALSAITESLDASCTNCHKQYRLNVFPREQGSK
jgi:hypothetical protein